MTMLDVVGSWSLERFLGQATGLEDGGVRFRNIFSTARTVYWILNAIYAILILLFSAFVGRLFHLSPAIALDARRALYVLAVWTLVVRAPLSAYNNALMATQDIAVANLISALGMVVRALAALGFVLAGGGLFGLMLAGTTGEAIASGLNYVVFKKRHPGLMAGWGLPDKALLREMLGFGGHSALVNAGTMLMFSSGNSLAGMTNGAGAASSFYTTQMPTLAVYNLLNRMNSSTMPALNELYGRGDLERVRQTFIRLMRVLLLMILPLSVGVLLFNHDIVYLVGWSAAVCGNAADRGSQRLLRCERAAGNRDSVFRSFWLGTIPGGELYSAGTRELRVWASGWDGGSGLEELRLPW